MRRVGATETLHAALGEVEGRLARAESTTVGDLVRSLGRHGVALAAALFVLPGLSPVSLGPLSTLMGILAAAAGLQLALGRDQLYLPRWLRSMEIRGTAQSRMRGALARASRMLHRLPRGGPFRLVRGRTGQLLCGGGIVAAAVILALPFPLLPFSNTLPATSTLLFSVGWSERSGWLVVAAVGVLVASASLAAGYVWVIIAVASG